MRKIKYLVVLSAIVLISTTAFAQLLTEGFEGTTFPPTGWVVYNADGGTQQWVRNTLYPRTGSAHASCRYETQTLQNNDWLVTPQIAIPSTGGTLRFWCRTSYASTPYDQLVVRLSTTGNAISDFTVVLDSFTVDYTTYQEKVYSLNSYANQNIYIAFVDRGLYAWTLCIDDVLVEGNFNNDVAVDDILTPGTQALLNASITPTAKIRNAGANYASNFAVICSIVGNTTGFLYTNTQTISLASGRDTVVSFGSYTPTTAQMCSVIVRSALVGDENPANDRKSKGCDVLPYIYIGTGTSGSAIYTMYCYYQYSVTERIYLQSEIGYYGTINSIAFYKTSGTNLDPIEGVSIYMKHTSEATLTTGAWSLDDYTLVYSGVFTNDNTSGWMEVSLSTPFLYNNFDNLAVLVVRDGPQITSGYPYYQYTSTSPTYRSRYAYSNTAMPTSLTATYYRTNVRFGFTAQTPPTTDAGVRAIIKPGASVLLGASINPQALIRNYGTAFQPQITVLCSIVGPGKVLRYLDSVNVSLSPQKDSVVTLPSWTTPSSPEVCEVRMRTVLAGDADPRNDRKTSTTEVGNYIIIGTGTSSAATYPIYRFYNYSVHEAIYLQSEIGYYGDLTHLAYYKASGTDVNPIDSVKIYMKHTSDTALSAGAYSLDDYTLVYEGQFPNNATEGWMEITLTTPFRYNNVENLQILVLKGYQAYISTYPYWRYTTVPQVRNRYAYSDASLPTTLSYTTTNLPNIRFQMTPQTPPAIDIAVTSILAPLTMLNPRTTTTSPVRAKIRNYSISTQTNIPVCCSIFSQTKAVVYVDHETIPSLGVFDTVTVPFNDWTLPGAGTYTVKVKAYKSGDENPNNDIQTRQTQIPIPYYTGGPDAGYYWWIDSDTLGGPTYNWIDISATGTDLPLTYGSWDDGYSQIPIGFNFTFYDNTYNTVYVGTNGFLSFGTGSTSLGNTALPDPTAPNNLICALWDDLHCGHLNSIRKYQVLGTSPNCTLVISFNNIRYYNDGDSCLAFQYLLLEGSNDIIIQYANVAGGAAADYGASATVGIENSDGSTGLQYLYNGLPAGNLLSANRAIRFYKYIYANDVGIDEILYPGAMHALNVPMTPKAKVKNYGTTAQSNFQVACTIFGAGNEVRYHSEKFISLAEGRDTTVEFDVWSVPTIEEQVTVKMATGLAGDEFPGNDIKTRTTTIQAVIDVGVASINRPTGTKDNEIKRIPFNPEVTVANYGSQNEAEVPVIAEIYYLGGKKQDDKNTAINPEIELATPEKQTFTIDPKTTDAISNMITKVRTNNKSKSIDYSVLWAIPLPHVACVGLTPVCIGDYPAGETLLWVSSGGRTGSTDPNWILIYNLNTRTLVDSFQQATTTTWGYRDMCFYNGYVYAGADAVLHKIDPVSHNVVGTYTVTGISYLRALMDNNVEDSLWTADWSSPIYKFYNQGGAVRQVNTNTYSIYGLAYDASRNCVWGSCQNQPTAHLVKYNYPDFTVADYTAIPELGSGIAGGCEMWGGKLLYLSQAAVDSVVCIAFPEPIYRDSILVSIPYGKASLDTFFKPCTLWTEGNYLIKAYTKLAGDMVPNNDMKENDFACEVIPLTLTSPADGAEFQNRTPTFEWTPVDGATLYRIQIATDQNFNNVLLQDVSSTTSWTVSEEDALADGTYYWHVRAEEPGTPDPYSTSRMFKVDNEGPLPPDTSSFSIPEGAVIDDPTPTFSWAEVSDAVKYNLLVEVGDKQVVIDETLDVNTYTPEEPLADGGYVWMVKCRDLAGNWGNYSDPRTFILSTGTPGWSQLESMPSRVTGKYVKDGGALTQGPSEGKTARTLYAFRGCKSKEFYKYTTGTPGVWTEAETIGFALKPPGLDSTKFNKKMPGKGASLCWDGENTIWATKGNGTFELWKYDLTDGHWYFESWIPSTKGAKGGTSLFFKDGLLYVLVGGQKTEYENFFAYDPVGKSWATLQKAPAGATAKPWKDGSAIVAIGNKIYGIKGGDKYNSFWAYDIGTNEWTEVESCPQAYPTNLIEKPKKIKVKDGGAMCTDGNVAYMIKGGGAQDFWMYTPNAIPPDTGLWTPLDTIPRLWKKSVPKTGAALAYVNGRVYLLKGNNTPEFWQYRPYTKLALAQPKPVANSAVMTEKSVTNLNFNFSVNPNPFNKFTTIRYTVPVSGKVSIKLYNASGQLIETLVNDYLNAGSYTTKLLAKHLANGIYFLKYEDAKNSSEIKLIVQ
ncbi:MAG: choice-of-anchor J domain-containing protein [candidate division WOR-3 bacterium]